MPAGKPTVARISLDVDVEQKQYLQMFSLQNGIPSSVTMRCLIYLLEVDVELQNRVIDEIFLSPDEVEVEYEGAAIDGGADVGEIEAWVHDDFIWEMAQDERYPIAMRMRALIYLLECM